MGALDDLRDGDGAWPPEGHADRIETQEDFQRLYRNRRDELVQRWSGDLLRYTARQEDLVPYPSAKVACRTLAAFLFGETPELRHEDEDISAALSAMSDAQSLPSRLLEGAVTQAAQGEVYLRPGWDADLSPWAILSTIPGRQVIPTFRFGMLADAAVVTTWEPSSKGEAVYWRLIEQHDRGTIRYALFRGTADRLGRQTDLNDTRGPNAAAKLMDGTRAGTETDLDRVVDTQVDELLLVHVPLGRDSESPHGVSLLDGVEALILGMHRLYSQEQHDAELARRRIAVAESYLPKDSSGRPVFDRKTDLFALSEDAMGAVGGDNRPVHPIEFRDDNVMRERIAGRFRDFLIAVGIAPDTLDAQEAGGAISGTSRRLAQAMTIQTASAAGRYWQDALARALALGLMVSDRHLGADVGELDALPSVSLADGLLDDPAELARILTDLDTAEAISTLEKVRRLHPTWTPDEVEAEVERILERSPDAPPAPPLSAFGGTSADRPLRAVDDA